MRRLRPRRIPLLCHGRLVRRTQRRRAADV